MMLLVLVCKAFQVDTSLYFEYVEATLDANPLLLFRIQRHKKLYYMFIKDQPVPWTLNILLFKVEVHDRQILQVRPIFCFVWLLMS